MKRPKVEVLLDSSSSIRSGMWRLVILFAAPYCEVLKNLCDNRLIPNSKARMERAIEKNLLLRVELDDELLVRVQLDISALWYCEEGTGEVTLIECQPVWCAGIATSTLERLMNDFELA
jgi:hypothetical protein